MQPKSILDPCTDTGVDTVLLLLASAIPGRLNQAEPAQELLLAQGRAVWSHWDRFSHKPDWWGTEGELDGSCGWRGQRRQPGLAGPAGRSSQIRKVMVGLKGQPWVVLGKPGAFPAPAMGLLLLHISQPCSSTWGEEICLHRPLWPDQILKQM